MPRDRIMGGVGFQGRAASAALDRQFIKEPKMSRLPQSVAGDSANTPTSRRRLPLKFFFLIFALSIPFWLAGAETRLQLFPGLPLAALMFVCPATAALILVYDENKIAGVIALLKRSFDYQRITAKVWYIPILLLMPGVTVLSYGLMRLKGAQLPTPQFQILAAAAMFCAFFIGAVGEELGWSGYITDPMQDRWGALQAGVLLGLVWAAWHVRPLRQAHRSPAWIAWWCLGTVMIRVVMVWLYNNTGKSVFAAALFHTTINVSWQLFPIHGSYYDPRVTSLIMTFVTAIVTVVWGPRTLARRRNV
jgi:membrane protease YdiL (CAAX protease family)